MSAKSGRRGGAELGRYASLFALPEWMDDPGRPCRGVDSALFFPTRGVDAGPAKAICAACPHLVDCREFAVEHLERGVWGGTCDVDRRRIRRERAKGAA